MLIYFSLDTPSLPKTDRFSSILCVFSPDRKMKQSYSRSLNEMVTFIKEWTSRIIFKDPKFFFLNTFKAFNNNSPKKKNQTFFRVTVKIYIFDYWGENEMLKF